MTGVLNDLGRGAVRVVGGDEHVKKRVVCYNYVHIYFTCELDPLRGSMSVDFQQHLRTIQPFDKQSRWLTASLKDAQLLDSLYLDK